MVDIDIDLENMMDSMNMTGQRQPVSVPILDESWEDKVYL